MDVATTYLNSSINTANSFLNKNASETNKNRLILAGSCVAAGLAIFFIVNSFSSPSISTANAWSLAVTLRFKSDSDKIEFKNNLAPYALYVEQNEPQTLSYILSESDKDPKQVHIMERYIDKNAYLNVHKKSPEFLAFRKGLLEMQNNGRVTIEGHSYQEVGIGYNRP